MQRENALQQSRERFSIFKSYARGGRHLVNLAPGEETDIRRRDVIGDTALFAGSTVALFPLVGGAVVGMLDLINNASQASQQKQLEKAAATPHSLTLTPDGSVLDAEYLKATGIEVKLKYDSLNLLPSSPGGNILFEVDTRSPGLYRLASYQNKPDALAGGLIDATYTTDGTNNIHYPITEVDSSGLYTIGFGFAPGLPGNPNVSFDARFYSVRYSGDDGLLASYIGSRALPPQIPIRQNPSP